jgi:N-methylhydantoinase B/oxoprolinase/acetone carboxylase alpha subunit
MKEIKNPLVANIERSNGNIEISIAKKYKETEEAMYKSFMSVCAMDDKALVNTKDMDKKATMAACGMQYDKMRAMMNEVGKGGLTEKQKKLPPALQKAILKKMKEDGKLSEEEEKEAEAKLLSKDDQKKKEVAIEDDMKVVKNPKKDA